MAIDLVNLNVTLPSVMQKSYPILIHDGLLNDPISWTFDFSKYHQIVVISDKIVAKLYGHNLVSSLNRKLNSLSSPTSKSSETMIIILEIEPGEESKTAATKEWLELEMLRHNLGRRTLCIALGGGVVGDLAGFVAATYMRGIDYIQVPTTLLAMIDSSVGGKTAIDTKLGKNLIGAFWQPQAVIMDLNCLNSLPKEHLIAGLVEAIKIFLTSNATMFDYVKKNVREILNYNEHVLQIIITESVKLKAHVVQMDEKEENLRMILNFGHTVGHGLEFVANYKLLHGYAVAFGIIIEAKIAVAMGKLKNELVLEIINLFKQLGVIEVLNQTVGYDVMQGMQYDIVKVDAILAALTHDKKNKNGKIYCILLKNIGEVSTAEDGLVATPVPVEFIRQSMLLL